jgi:hypothetical protein
VLTPLVAMAGWVSSVPTWDWGPPSAVVAKHRVPLLSVGFSTSSAKKSRVPSDGSPCIGRTTHRAIGIVRSAGESVHERSLSVSPGLSIEPRVQDYFYVIPSNGFLLPRQ